jgi:transcriptional regulator
VRHNPLHADENQEVVRDLIRDHPWSTLVSEKDDQLVASHYPVLVDDESSELAVVTHLGRPDDQVHGIGSREVLLIVQGNHGYISPSWYAPGAIRVPTWNFSVVHCYGVPQLLDPDQNLKVLTRLVERFERDVESPLFLDPDYAKTLINGTVGIRIPITRFICKRKLSQDKDPRTQRQVIAALRAPGPYHDAALAEDMEHALGALASDQPA